MTPWTVSCQAPLSVGYSRQECWSGLHATSQPRDQTHITSATWQLHLGFMLFEKNKTASGNLQMELKLNIGVGVLMKTLNSLMMVHGLPWGLRR